MRAYFNWKSNRLTFLKSICTLKVLTYNLPWAFWHLDSVQKVLMVSLLQRIIFIGFFPFPLSFSIPNRRRHTHMLASKMWGRKRNTFRKWNFFLAPLLRSFFKSVGRWASERKRRRILSSLWKFAEIYSQLASLVWPIVQLGLLAYSLGVCVCPLAVYTWVNSYSHSNNGPLYIYIHRWSRSVNMAALTSSRTHTKLNCSQGAGWLKTFAKYFTSADFWGLFLDFWTVRWGFHFVPPCS